MGCQQSVRGRGDGSQNNHRGERSGHFQTSHAGILGLGAKGAFSAAGDQAAEINS
jgi:hypothetical protein